VGRACFSGERERFGPADHKIWATSSVSADSVGRGESVPAALIPPQITDAINELAGKLGYRLVDAEWGTPGRPSDPRDQATVNGSPVSPGLLPCAVTVPGSDALEQWLRSRVENDGEQVARRWESCAADRFVVVSRTVTGGSEAQWVVDITSRTVVPDDGQEEDVAWSLLAAPETWQAVQAGRDNLLSVMRRSELRYCAAEEDSPVLTQTRVAMLSDLLGLSSWSVTDTVPESAAAAVVTAAS